MALNRRQKMILSSLGGGAYVEVKELADQLDVDASTIRRDLQTLSSLDLVERLHGGVRLNGLSGVSDSRAAAEPVAIAGAARRLLKAGERIALGSGPVADRLVPLLFDLPDLVVVTNDVRSAESLAKRDNITVRLAGGDVRESGGFLTTTGPSVVSFFEDARCDWCLIEVEGIHPYGGFTTSRPWEVATKRAILESARKRTVLAGTEAFGVRCVGFIADCQSADLLITGDSLPDAELPVFGGRVVRASADRHATWDKR